MFQPTFSQRQKIKVVLPVGVPDPVLGTGENVFASGGRKYGVRDLRGLGNPDLVDLRGSFRLGGRDAPLIEHPLTRLAEISRFVGITPTPPPGVAAGLGHSLSPAKMVVSDSRASSSSSR